MPGRRGRFGFTWLFLVRVGSHPLMGVQFVMVGGALEVRGDVAHGFQRSLEELFDPHGLAMRLARMLSPMRDTCSGRCGRQAGILPGQNEQPRNSALNWLVR